MSFVLSKLLWLLIQPSNLLLLMILLAASLARRWPGATRRLLSLTLTGVVTITFLPVGQWLLMPIEQRFPEVRTPPPDVDGIIVLGGGVDAGPSIARSQLALNAGAERLTASAWLAKRYPDAKLVYSGGSGRLVGLPFDLAEGVRAFYVRQGLDPDRIMFEGTSRNTLENAVFSSDLVAPEPDETWLLVTSASHMPRSVGIFRKIGWNVVPFPVDYRHAATLGLKGYLNIIVQPDVGQRLVELDDGLRAWVGLIAYWLMGRTSALFPEP